MKELIDFWKELKNSSEIKFKDIEKLEILLSRAFSKIEELEKSREKWKKRALNKKKK